ncbi:unnamed protein product [Cylicostephanus goldi]|uniref:Uncharacterized protein n=1 Tax=Cylicostephanus goldi TaxID=71465 RepID=A0A3P6RK55_CYLGO|nr:unnamed protein product [Cylicostephanus goldi]
MFQRGPRRESQRIRTKKNGIDGGTHPSIHAGRLAGNTGWTNPFIVTQQVACPIRRGATGLGEDMGRGTSAGSECGERNERTERYWSRFRARLVASRAACTDRDDSENVRFVPIIVIPSTRAEGRFCRADERVPRRSLCNTSAVAGTNVCTKERNTYIGRLQRTLCFLYVRRFSANADRGQKNCISAKCHVLHHRHGKTFELLTQMRNSNTNADKELMDFH